MTLAGQRISRRRILAWGGLAAAPAIGGVVAGAYLGRRDRPASTAEAPPTPAPAPSQSQSPAVTPTPTALPRTGGIARLPARHTLSFDTFDAALTGEVSVGEVLGRTHSRLVTWRPGPGTPELEPDLAASWEMPEPGRYLLRLDRRARWSMLPGIEPRPVNAPEVAGSLERFVALAAGKRPIVQRAHDWAVVERATDVGGGMVEVRLKSPDSYFLATLAARFSFIQEQGSLERLSPQEVLEDPGRIRGSGPFRFGGTTAGGSLRLNAWTEGHRVPRVDGIEVSQPAQGIEPFLASALDEAVFRDRRELPAVRAAFGERIRAVQGLEDAPVISTMFVGAPPWSDARLRRALRLALPARELAERLFGGRAVADDGAFLAPPAGDGSEARALWEAGGGPGLGTVTIDFPSIFDPLYSASSVVTGMLNAALGGQFRPAVETYTTISAKAIDHAYGSGKAAFWLGWGPPPPEPDPSRWLIETYSSRGPGFAATGFVSADLDAALAALRSEVDTRRRPERLASVRKLLAEDCGGHVPWCWQTTDIVRRAYLDRPAPSAWWQEQDDVRTAIDATDSDYRSR